MKVTLESTDQIVELNGVPARIWEGATENGIPCHALITRIGVSKEADACEFERDLQRTRSPSAALAAAYPLRMIL